MRIAIIAPPWLPVPPVRYGGTEAVIDGLARGLLSAGHDVLLFTTGDSTCPVPTDWVLPEAVGIGNGGTTAEVRHVMAGYEAAIAWGADIVHDHTTVGPSCAAHLPSAPPVVTTNHGPFDGDLAAYYRTISRRVSVVAISRQHAASAPAGTSIAAVIHHGIDVDRFEPGRGDGGYALFLGRMCEDKGVRTAIHTARAAGVPLKIAAKASEPAERAYFESAVRPLLGDGVEFLGEVGGADKVKLLGAASCLLNPVRWAEPFGMVMIEALACGTPVVATPEGAVPEIVDDGITGFVRPAGSALVAALAGVRSIPRTACRAAAVERFSVERMVADHVAFYERVAAGGLVGQERPGAHDRPLGELTPAEEAPS